MRLISCHIENFGVLSSEDIDFSKDLNLTIKENGWGKSTLASFLRAMFYGLNGEGKKDELVCERKRFAPWQGGAFGGSVAFEVEGKEYVLSRFFGAKAAEDVFELRNKETNLLSKDYSENIGEELFSINAESFMKTVYISQNDSGNTQVTDDINAKLGNITDSIDLNKFANAQESLKDALNAYSATRKTGEIYKLKERQSLLKSKIQASNGVEDSLREIEERMSVTKKGIDDAKEELNYLSKQKGKVSQYEKSLNLKATYDNLTEEIKQKEALINERRAFFKGEVPSKNVCDSWEDACDKIKEADAVIFDTTMSDVEASIYSNLLQMFKDDVPSEDRIEELLNESRQILSIKTQASKYSLSEDEEERLEDYNALFETPENAENEIGKCFENVSLNNKYANECVSLESKLSEGRKSGNSNAVSAILFILAIVIVGFSFAYRALSLPVYFLYAGIGVALVLLIIGFIALLSKKTQSKDPSFLKAQDRLYELNERIDANNEYVSNFLDKFDIPFDDERVSFDLQNLSRNIYEYKSLFDKKKQLSALGEGEDYSLKENKIKEFLAKYSIYASGDDLPEKLADLKGKAHHYLSLKAKNDSNVRAKANKDRLKSDLKEQLANYQIDPGIDMANTVDDCLNVVTEYESVLALLNDAKERLDAFTEANDLSKINDALNDESRMTFDEIHEKENRLNETLETLRDNLTTDNRTYDDYEQKFEARQEDTEELNALSEDIKNKLSKLNMVSIAQEYLTKAKEALTEKYMEPLLKGFIKYYSFLTKEDAGSFHIDANMVLTKEEKGMQRSTGYLSFGYRDLIGFCMRLAVADAMYEGEKPMLILDDPFVNLDDEKAKEAKRLLKEVSKYYQVIYLTCSESRL